MQTGQVSPQDIYETALRIFSREEIRQMPKQQSLSLMGMVERRLLKKKDLTQEELEGVKILLLDHLWPPELTALHKALVASPMADKPED